MRSQVALWHSASLLKGRSSWPLVVEQVLGEPGWASEHSMPAGVGGVALCLPPKFLGTQDKEAPRHGTRRPSSGTGRDHAPPQARGESLTIPVWLGGGEN